MAKQPFNKAQDWKNNDSPTSSDANAKYDGAVMENPINTIISEVPATPEGDQNPKSTKTNKGVSTINLKVLVRNESNMLLPKYETVNAAGLDVRASIKDPVIIPAHGVRLIGTGLFVAIPEGYECQVRPRSGLALKHGITVLNSPGTIDADYRGEIGVILINHTNENYRINPGDKIAQLVFHKYERIEWQEVDELPETERGEGGFGHTGK